MKNKIFLAMAFAILLFYLNLASATCSGTVALTSPNGNLAVCSSVLAPYWNGYTWTYYYCNNSVVTSGAYWQGGNYCPQWIYFDFGSTKCISGVEMLPIYVGTGNTALVDIQTSPDTSTWTNVSTGWNFTYNGVTAGRNFTETEARYLRLSYRVCGTWPWATTMYLRAWIRSSSQCSPPAINQNWTITDAQTCDATTVNIGTGHILVVTGGTLKLINAANITSSGLEIRRTGDSVFIYANSRLMVY